MKTTNQPAEGRWKLKTVLSVIQTSSIILLAVSILITYKGIMDQNEWNRSHNEFIKIQKASEILRMFNPLMNAHRAPIFMVFPGLHNKAQSKPESRDFFKKLIAARPGSFLIPVHKSGETSSSDSVDAFYLRHHLMCVFNYFEDVTNACEYNMANEKMLEDSLGLFMIRFYNFFQNFIIEVDLENEGETWPTLEKVIKSWEVNKRNRKPV